jgi:hypothetical protein
MVRQLLLRLHTNRQQNVNHLGMLHSVGASMVRRLLMVIRFQGNTSQVESIVVTSQIHTHFPLLGRKNVQVPVITEMSNSVHIEHKY